MFKVMKDVFENVYDVVTDSETDAINAFENFKADGYCACLVIDMGDVTEIQF